jgi:type I restriction enzyme S subunit
MAIEDYQTYEPAGSADFRKTHEEFGGLSNMAGGFPLRVNDVNILTSEALYQACRFPHLPEVQRLIIDQKSPMTAKMKSRPYRDQSRLDWDAVRVRLMRWCLRVKLAQNWPTFSELLLSTGGRPIVEESKKDDFWGAKPQPDGTLVGRNVLGRLLMELREELKQPTGEALKQVEPVPIPDFLLYGQPIQPVQA